MKLTIPHAAIAKQAVDQISKSLLSKRVTNLIGDLPIGSINAGSKLGIADQNASGKH